MSGSGMARHRFVGKVGALCEERFGGAGKCALSYGASMHYNDQDHPYHDGGKGGECQWVLQNVPEGSGRPEYCCGDKGDPIHHHTPVDVSVADTAKIEVELPSVEDWQQALVGMPDVAAEARAESLDEAATRIMEQASSDADKIMTALAEEAGAYAWNAQRPEAGGPELAADGYPAEQWARAVCWLETEDVELTYGPWPVRKFLLWDNDTAQDANLLAVLRHLNDLDQTYALVVTRPVDAPYRVALLTWDWARGLMVDAICDELAARYGE